MIEAGAASRPATWAARSPHENTEDCKIPRTVGLAVAVSPLAATVAALVLFSGAASTSLTANVH